MRKMFGFFLVVLLVAILGNIAWLALRPHEYEPVYKGKPLRHWLEYAAKSNIEEEQTQALEAIKILGTNAVPTLIRMMQEKDSPLKVEVMALAAKQSLIRFDFTRASDLHLVAAYGCSILKDKAEPAIPTLIELLPKEKSTLVAGALADIGPDGVLALVGAMTNRDADVRFNVALALGSAGIKRHYKNITPEQIAIINQETKIAVPALIELLKDKDDSVRGQAATSLGVLGSDKENVVPALIATLEDPANSSGDSRSAISAAHALGRFHHEAEAAVPALLIALKNPILERAAADALKAIDPEAAATVDVK